MPKQRFRAPHLDSHTSYASRLTAQQLLKEPVVGEISSFEGDPNIYMLLGLRDGNGITARIEVEGEYRIGIVQYLGVKKPLQRHGIGEKLMRVCVSEIKALGARELLSDSVSTQALFLRAKVFGAQALEFYDSEVGLLPLSYEQAIASNRLVDSHYPNDQRYKIDGEHIGVAIDLSTIDTTGWERAQILRNDLAGISLGS